MYCNLHEDWICEECFAEHADHFGKTAKGTNKHVYNMLRKIKKVLIILNKTKNLSSMRKLLKLII